jgi:hypothetical protein
MKFWSNLAGYQLVWFLTVTGAGRGLAWPALVSACVFIVWQMLTADRPTVELRLLIAAVLLGICVDGILAASGWAHYAAATPALPSGGAPLWILALWASFAMTLNQSLRYLNGRPFVAFAFGAIGAPLAYLSAARGWQALVFEAPTWRGLLWIAVGWAIAMPLLATLAHRWNSGPARLCAVTQRKSP